MCHLCHSVSPGAMHWTHKLRPSTSDLCGGLEIRLSPCAGLSAKRLTARERFSIACAATPSLPLQIGRETATLQPRYLAAGPRACLLLVRLGLSADYLRYTLIGVVGKRDMAIGQTAVGLHPVGGVRA